MNHGNEVTRKSMKKQGVKLFLHMYKVKLPVKSSHNFQKSVVLNQGRRDFLFKVLILSNHAVPSSTAISKFVSSASFDSALTEYSTFRTLSIQ